MALPPGLIYLSRRLPRLLLLPLSLYFLATRLFPHVNTIIWVLLGVLSVPVVFTVSVLHKDYTNKRRAAALGAVLPPRIRSKWPGGFSTLKTAVSAFKIGVPGGISTDWIQKYGYTINTRVFFEDRYVTFEPEHIKAILATQFEHFEKGPVSYNQFYGLLGTGVFNSDGEMWKFHRNITRPFFNKERLSDFDIFSRHADDAIRQLKARLTEGYAVDIQDVASRFTLDSATEFLFGKDVHSLSAGLPYPPSSSLAQSSASVQHFSNTFAHAFARGQSNIAMRARFGLHWPLFEFWKDRARKYRRIVDKFIDPILNGAIAKNKAVKGSMSYNESKGNAADAETLLDHLVNFTNDHEVLKDEIVNITVAGRDTTATCISFAVYMLAEHPDVLKKLRSEVLEKVGSTSRPTYDDLRNMKYLRAVINEVLRLYPSVPSNSRTNNKETVWPGKSPNEKSIYVPPHTRCSYGVFHMHRRKDLWGPDALEFDPDRFLDERLHKYLIPNPFIFLPFNAGPRICLGQQFAYHEISFFLIRLVQAFSDISLAPDAQPPASRPPDHWASFSGFKEGEKIWSKAHLTMYAVDGIWVRMQEAAAVSDS